MEPNHLPAGVHSVDAAAHDDLGAFYGLVYPRIVALLAVSGGSRSDAEEIAQDAFVRLIPRWKKVSHYDNPEAWVRRVALRLAANRARRSRNGTSAFRKLAPIEEEQPAATPGTAIECALSALPIPQRQVVVLHYLLGWSVEEVAIELAIRPGTVKSRLARARAVLAPLLAEEMADHNA